ncbi:MAG: tellurite resistance/C4-dicarboxylate transporter family protein [Sciscionella sp.]
MLQGVGERVRHSVATLAPGYFALVMATGIISVGMRLQGYNALSLALLAVCALAFVVLAGLLGWRLVAYRQQVRADFSDAGRAFGFFTVVAGANVLGTRLGVQGFPAITAVLLAVAGVLWVVLGYAIPWTAVLGQRARPVTRAANGTWFIWCVASQSVAVAAATIEPMVGAGRRAVALLAVSSWAIGGCLYVGVAILVTVRAMEYPLTPEDLNPPYWVSMGAVAITILAAARILAMADAPVVSATRGLVAGVAVVLWAFASWLYPVLCAMGWWRHVRHAVPLSYDATVWSIVFPLGMYAVASRYLGAADQLPIVGTIGAIELWVSFAAWLVAAAAMLAHLWRTVGSG